MLREKGILWISDEVQTGWGRTGEHFWGWQAHGATPDLVTFAKGVGNGLSMGGVIAPASSWIRSAPTRSRRSADRRSSSAGALANLRYLLDHRLQDNAARQGPVLFEGLRAIDSPHVGDVRGKGLMIGVELVRDGTPLGYREHGAGGHEAPGVLIGKGGLHGNALRIAPPLSLTRAEAEEGLAALVAAIEEVP